MTPAGDDVPNEEETDLEEAEVGQRAREPTDQERRRLTSNQTSKLTNHMPEKKFSSFFNISM